jgi:hypothetical protein
VVLKNQILKNHEQGCHPSQSSNVEQAMSKAKVPWNLLQMPHLLTNRIKITKNIKMDRD